jgi:hypothetical protein
MLMWVMIEFARNPIFGSSPCDDIGGLTLLSCNAIHAGWIVRGMTALSRTKVFFMI